MKYLVWRIALAEWSRDLKPKVLPDVRTRFQLADVQSKPQLLAWLTCDGTHFDPSSGKYTILGIFSNIKAQRFPITHPLMIWFLTLTDVSPGPHRMRISIGLDPTLIRTAARIGLEPQRRSGKPVTAPHRSLIGPVGPVG